MRHVRQLLAFTRRKGPEFVLVGRGHAMVMRSQGFIAKTLSLIVTFVQMRFPAPYPELTCSTLEQADAFLEGIAIECRKENNSLTV